MDGDSWEDDDEVGTLLAMIGGEIIPMLEFLEASFESNIHELTQGMNEEDPAPAPPA
jgi:hypothetical protein